MLRPEALNIVLNDLQRRSRNDAYLWDPCLWAEEVLGVFLWTKQKEMLMSLAHNKRTAVKSAHSTGKSYTMGIAACWWVATRPTESLVVSTAPTYGQVHAILWQEIRKHWMNAELPGEVTQGDVWNMAVKRSDGKTNREMLAFGRRPADYNEQAFSGLHRVNGVLFLIDEAVGCPRMIFTAAEVNTTAANCRILAIANPDDAQTDFGEIFLKEDPTWNRMTISAYDTPNFTGEYVPEVVALNMPQRQWVEDMKIRWGEDSSRFKSKILAEFPDQSDFMFFTQKDIDIATDFDPEDSRYARDFNDRPVLGMDIARFGDDFTTVYARQGSMVEFIDKWGQEDLVQSAERITQIVKRLDASELRLDGAGIGAGVVDYLAHSNEFPHHRCKVIPMLGGGAAKDNFVHMNARAERHDELKKLIRDGSVKISADAKDLIDEMLAIRFQFNGKGAIQIESKQDMKSRGTKSPDHLDAVTYAISDVSWLFGPKPGDKLTVSAQSYANRDDYEGVLGVFPW